ncbi:LicD family protein [Pseudomonas sp. SJZ085]|uniref:nucleoside-diphosphate sugar epimerase/dehydratase n=1 Tax=unclassified Pseudomonas TaxID=196821 RepID=UPI00119C7158|nr:MULTISPECIES: LicD family protein [unclassified Pseudomonas]TWC21737.1 LicD family protein [Pseudomonas sp. SJZ074]TWC39389.1 LicD family protein [Pseudomonas sp. SJZ085]
MVPEQLKEKRLVLFGAGRVARLMFARFPELKVVAFADNDPLKEGTFVGPVPVVLPSALHSLDYDLVVISTGWWESITAQLQELGVPAEKIIIPPKNMLAVNSGAKPFSHDFTKALAVEAIQRVGELAKTFSLPILLDFGTLLGATRDGDLIPWDDDIDFSINDDEFPLLLDHLPDLKSLLPHREGVCIEIIVLKSGDFVTGVSVTFENAADSDLIVPFELGFMRRIFEDGKSVTKSSGPEFIAPEVHFRSADTTCFLDRQFLTPHDVPGYLTYVYGNWQAPKRDVTLADYPMQEPDYRETSRSVF